MSTENKDSRDSARSSSKAKSRTKEASKKGLNQTKNSTQFTQGFDLGLAMKESMRHQDIQRIMSIQNKSLKNFAKTNELLGKFNDFSSSKYDVLQHMFLQHTQLLVDLKKGLTDVFLRIRRVKARLQQQHPEAFEETFNLRQDLEDRLEQEEADDPTYRDSMNINQGKATKDESEAVEENESGVVHAGNESPTTRKNESFEVEENKSQGVNGDKSQAADEEECLATTKNESFAVEENKSQGVNGDKSQAAVEDESQAADEEECLATTKNESFVVEENKSQGVTCNGDNSQAVDESECLADNKNESIGAENRYSGLPNEAEKENSDFSLEAKCKINAIEKTEFSEKRENCFKSENDMHEESKEVVEDGMPCENKDSQQTNVRGSEKDEENDGNVIHEGVKDCLVMEHSDNSNR